MATFRDAVLKLSEVVDGSSAVGEMLDALGEVLQKAGRRGYDTEEVLDRIVLGMVGLHGELLDARADSDELKVELIKMDSRLSEVEPRVRPAD